jgi:hypothetical protein
MKYLKREFYSQINENLIQKVHSDEMVERLHNPAKMKIIPILMSLYQIEERR